ncbi:MAG: hypothetical protein ABEI57_07305 [Halapricum sp.]
METRAMGRDRLARVVVVQPLIAPLLLGGRGRDLDVLGGDAHDLVGP